MAEQNNPHLLQLVDQIEILGYFRYVKPERIPRLKSLFVKKPNLWSVNVKRYFFADEAVIAPCGAGYGAADLLKNISPILKKVGIRFKQLDEQCSDEGHYMALNGQRYLLVSREELEAADSKYIVAGYKTPRTFALINKLFQDVNSDERIYSIYGANDHRAFILPEAVYNLFLEHKIEDAYNLKMYNPSDHLSID